MREWLGKTYWIVGASDGLGEAIAHHLSKLGVRLILSARSEDKLTSLSDALPGPSVVAPVDMSDAEALARVADEVGEIDGVIQVAGVYWPFGAKEWDAEQANAMADINFGGVMRLMGVIVPRFVERGTGHIVLTGSLSGYRGLPDAAPYAASKAAVMALAESLYADLRKTDIDVQLINPGFIKTRLTDKNSFSMPFIMEPDQAAQISVDHMSTDRFQKAFPTFFSLIFRGSQLLPDWLYFRLFA